MSVAQIGPDRIMAERGAVGGRALPTPAGDLLASVIKIPAGIAVAPAGRLGPIADISDFPLLGQPPGTATPSRAANRRRGWPNTASQPSASSIWAASIHGFCGEGISTPRIACRVRPASGPLASTQRRSTRSQSRGVLAMCRRPMRSVAVGFGPTGPKIVPSRRADRSAREPCPAAFARGSRLAAKCQLARHCR